MDHEFSVRVESDALKVMESFWSLGTLDEVLEVFSASMLGMKKIRRVDVYLMNSRGSLVLVSSARNVEYKGQVKQEVMVQGWALESPVSHSSRRTPLPEMGAAFCVPLVAWGELMGFVEIRLSQVSITSSHQVGSFCFIGLQLAAKIKETALTDEVSRLKAEVRDLTTYNREILDRSTALSKELYAISAVSTKINQSLGCDRSLQKSVAKIKDIFKASNIVVYARTSGKSGLQLSMMEHNGAVLLRKDLNKIRKLMMEEFIKAERPLVLEHRFELSRNGAGPDKGLQFQPLVAVPLKAKGSIIGAMALLRQGEETFSQENIRLLSGIANIMGMAMENMNLYRQSEQREREATFLARSIEKFNEKLDLQETLESVAQKGVKFIAERCLIYLATERKMPLLQAIEVAGGGEHCFVNKNFEQIEPRELKDFLEQVMDRGRPVLLTHVGQSRRVPCDARASLVGRGMHSAMLVPLKVKMKGIGLLLLSNGQGGRVFDRHDLDVAKALGGAATLPIQNALIYAASLELSDFLEKKIAEKTNQIAEIEEKERAKIESRNDLVFRINRENRFVFANRAMENYSGCTREELYQGKVLACELVAEEDRQRVLSCFRQILAGELSLVRNLEYRHLNRDGDDHWIALTIYPETDHQGQISGFEGIGRDITEKKRLESELEKTKNLALLGEFSSAVAHQVRNPLSNILMGAKLLERTLGLGSANNSSELPGISGSPCSRPGRAQVGHIFRDLTEGIKTLNQVIAELLNYTRTLKLSRSSQQIDILLQESLHMFEEMILKNGIEVRKHFEPDLPPVSLDAVLMGQVFQNVIHNALQAMPDSGCLSLRAGLSGEKKGYTKITVRDTGAGIAEADLDKIFRPFYTTKNNGTGLGLSLAHRILEAHGGYIWAGNNTSGGADICIMLPIDGSGRPVASRANHVDGELK